MGGANGGSLFGIARRLQGEWIARPDDDLASTADEARRLDGTRPGAGHHGDGLQCPGGNRDSKLLVLHARCMSARHRIRVGLFLSVRRDAGCFRGGETT